MALRVAVALIVAAISFVIRFVMSNQSTDFVTRDGIYELSYSGYWSEPMESLPPPPTLPPGGQVDLTLGSEDSMFFAAHGPAPGPAANFASALNDAALRQAFESASGATLEEWSLPGKRDIGGERALLDASGYVEVNGMRADFELAVDVTDGAQPQMLMFIHTCPDTCEKSTGEFEKILESVSYNEEVAA
jgi:hypothetical protein